MLVFLLCALLSITAAPGRAHAGQVRATPDAAVDVASLLEEMLDRSAAARGTRAPYTAHMRSSTDPRSVDPSDPEAWFANEDAGHYERVDERDGRREVVLLDVAGPGALVRIWCGNPRGTLSIYVDGATEPAVREDSLRLLTGRGSVAAPLAAERSRGANFYFPIPFAQRCVVTCDDAAAPLYYQVQYRAFAAGTQVRSFRLGDFDEYRALAQRVGRALTEPAPDEADATLPFSFSLTPGAQAKPVHSLELDVSRNLHAPPGARAITELRLHLEPVGPGARERLEEILRQSVLSIRFDGTRTVHVPVGDFFGTAPGANAFRSWPLSVEPGGDLVARFWMPFRESCVLRLDCAVRERIALRGSVATRAIDWTDDTLYFHAQWRSAAFATRPARDWTLLEVEGRGVYVGDMLSVANPLLAWWGEGDEKIYVDGAPTPAFFGTGTDDYYGFASSSSQLFEAPFHNQTRCDGPQNFGHTSLNRFRALDAIPFSERLRFDLGVLHWAETELTLAATTYFYAELDARCIREAEVEGGDVTDAGDTTQLGDSVRLVGAGVPRLTYEPFRIAGALECEELEVSAHSEGLATETQYRDPLPGAAWSGGTLLRVGAERVGQFIEWKLPPTDSPDGQDVRADPAGTSAGQPPERTLTAYMSGSSECGQVQFFLDGEPFGPLLDAFRASEGVQPPEPFVLGTLPPGASPRLLRAEIVSTNELSRPPHYTLFLDCLVLE